MEDEAPEDIIEERPIKEGVKKTPSPIVAKSLPPFPRRLQKVKYNNVYKKFLDIYISIGKHTVGRALCDLGPR